MDGSGYKFISSKGSGAQDKEMSYGGTVNSFYQPKNVDLRKSTATTQCCPLFPGRNVIAKDYSKLTN